jgi:FKBP-type peptidyl-prolyl cis-trans isomerase SlyD
LVEQTHDSKPLQFIFGIGQMIPSFEENLEEMVAGDSFAFLLNAQDAYGEFDENYIINVPIENFADESGNVDRDKLKVGEMIQMQDQSGNSYQGFIKEMKLEGVIVDFNHPMAGKNLYFQGEILEVREPSESEQDHGHVHE